MCLECLELDFYAFIGIWISPCYFGGSIREKSGLTQIALTLLFNILGYCARLMMLKFLRLFE